MSSPVNAPSIHIVTTLEQAVIVAKLKDIIPLNATLDEVRMQMGEILQELEAQPDVSVQLSPNDHKSDSAAPVIKHPYKAMMPS